MTPAWLGLLAGVCLAGGFALLWWRARLAAQRLRSRLETSSRELERLQQSFSTFAPEALVERIIDGSLPAGGETKEVTVLFADLVGFTSLAERLPAHVLVDIMNGYFERMSRAILAHSGHVSTYLGDGILALFGALQPNPWQANDAAHAALAMHVELAAYNRELEARHLPPLSIGVGLHRGRGVAGLVGSTHKKEYAIVGRTVNVAARIQDLTRAHEAGILVSGELAASLDPRFRLRAQAPAELRGIQEPVAIFALERDSEAESQP
jgi:class 3 adenylate cyclase